MMENFHMSSVTTDITDIIVRFENYIQNHSLDEVLWNFVHIIPLGSREQIGGDSITSNLFSSIVLDTQGRKKCVVPSVLNAGKVELQYVAEYRCAKIYEIQTTAFLSRYYCLLSKKYTISEKDIAFVFEDNLFVCDDQKESYVKGIVAGFNGDFITSMHILMPQVERSIRCLAEQCGAITYKTDVDGTESCLGLGAVLGLSELQECVEEDLLFNMRLFYSSQYGIGMRDQIGHGLLCDHEIIASWQSLATWWFTLRLCCVCSPELRKNLIKASK